MTPTTIENLNDAHAARAQSAGEQRIVLPMRTLLMLMAVATLVVCGCWAGTVAIAQLGSQSFTSGMLGIGLVGVLSMAGVVLMTPWKPRIVADWMTMWLAATVFRVLVTPLAAFLLYSAASSVLAAKPLALAVASTYLVTLFVEAAVLSAHLKRSFPVGTAALNAAATNGTHRS